MSSSTIKDRLAGPASLYATRQPLLFLALAPVMVCMLIILVPASVAGLFLIIPGLSGLAGLVGLTMAWFGLLAPGFAMRREGTIVFLLVCSVPAIILGLCLLASDTRNASSHWVDPMMAAGPASAAFFVLAAFFLTGVMAWNSAAIKPVAIYIRRWKIAGIVVACMTLPIPLGYALIVTGYQKTIRQQQGAQADVLSRRAMTAVDQYRSAHAGAFPPDNASAGLPAPTRMRDTYVASVTLAGHEVTLKYSDNAVVRLLGAGAADVSLTFRPADFADGTYSIAGPSHWACHSSGYSLESDLPLLLNGRCR